MKKLFLIDIIGWLGVSAVLLAYALVSFHVVQPISPIYHLLNLFGAGGIIVEAYLKKDTPTVALNVVWLVIASVSIVIMFF